MTSFSPYWTDDGKTDHPGVGPRSVLSAVFNQISAHCFNFVGKHNVLSNICFSAVIGWQHGLGSVCPAREIKEHQSVCLIESRKTGLHAMVLIRLTQV